LLSLPSIRKLLLRFDRAVKKNQEQRSKYPDDPSKSVLCFTLVHITLTVGRFIDSEADLDVAIKALLPLSQAPSLAYPEMVRFGTIETLVGLLSHENTDIVIDVVEVVHELTDEDVGDEEPDVDEDDENKEVPLKTLIDGLVSEVQITIFVLAQVVL
jgi:beta-catenin-like protein 1